MRNKVTKNERELITVIETLMKRKRVYEGDPKTMYKVSKRSNKDYFAEARVGDHFFATNGKDKKTAIKNLIKELTH